MNPEPTREIERKYEVPENATLPEAGELAAAVAGVCSVDEERVFELSADYYDTEDGRLAAARIALRRREGGHDAGWHIKADTPEGRFERQWALDEPAASVGEDPVPAAVRAALAGMLGGTPFSSALAPIARLATTRRTRVLRDAAGRGLVEIADDRVSARDHAAGLSRGWREWEAELLEAAPAGEAGEALLDAVGAALARAGAVPSASHSKIARALGR